MNKIIASAVLATLLMSSSAFAQTTPAPAAPAAPAAAPAAAPDAPMMDKKAKSKDCYMQADKQGLHGKARKKFHSKCARAKM